MDYEIRLLDQKTANQIAAGEVVEKPASVVKELVENSLDAQATSIDVAIYEGGIDYIRVTDNGRGMSEANAKLAVVRHATSKIRQAEDLLTITSLGFRGEALPSIASVSHFQLLTRLAEEEFATSVTIEGGGPADVMATGANLGTSIIVKDLFYNVPARRKFLRTVSTEGRYINEIMTKLALSRPDVHFTLENNDKEILNTPGTGELLDTILSIYGKKVKDELLEVHYNSEGISLQGYISKPTLLKGTRQWQTFFVNQRAINNRMLSKAVDHAYQSQIPKSGFPFVLLKLEVATASIDVNVHPQKSEIKFSDESAIYKAVYHAVSEALTQPTQGRSAWTEESTTELPTASHSFSTGNSFTSSISTGEGSRSAFPPPQLSIWKTPELVQEKQNTPVMPFGEAQAVLHPNVQAPAQTIAYTNTQSGIDTIWPLGQINKVFIVAQSETALYLIDQHAAHERVMYDKLVASHQDIPTQQLLLPLYLEVTDQELTEILEHREEFLKLGVELDAGGEGLLRVASLPADVHNEQAEEFIREIIKLLDEKKDIKPTDLRAEVLHYAACHSAIRAGEMLNISQMRQLILELLNTEHPFTCPHGRPCMIEITTDELFKMFKRT